MARPPKIKPAAVVAADGGPSSSAPIIPANNNNVAPKVIDVDNFVLYDHICWLLLD